MNISSWNIWNSSGTGILVNLSKAAMAAMASPRLPQPAAILSIQLLQVLGDVRQQRSKATEVLGHALQVLGSWLGSSWPSRLNRLLMLELQLGCTSCNFATRVPKLAAHPVTTVPAAICFCFRGGLRNWLSQTSSPVNGFPTFCPFVTWRG